MSFGNFHCCTIVAYFLCEVLQGKLKGGSTREKVKARVRFSKNQHFCFIKLSPTRARTDTELVRLGLPGPNSVALSSKVVSSDSPSCVCVLFAQELALDFGQHLLDLTRQVLHWDFLQLQHLTADRRRWLAWGGPRTPEVICGGIPLFVGNDDQH